MNLLKFLDSCSCCAVKLKERQYRCTLLTIEADELADSFDFRLCEDCYAQVELAIGQMLRQNLRAATAKFRTEAAAVGLDR